MDEENKWPSIWTEAIPLAEEIHEAMKEKKNWSKAFNEVVDNNQPLLKNLYDYQSKSPFRTTDYVYLGELKNTTFYFLTEFCKTEIIKYLQIKHREFYEKLPQNQNT
jgi:hypothetical protein